MAIVWFSHSSGKCSRCVMMSHIRLFSKSLTLSDSTYQATIKQHYFCSVRQAVGNFNVVVSKKDLPLLCHVKFVKNDILPCLQSLTPYVYGLCYHP